jgi:hypothetical protein
LFIHRLDDDLKQSSSIKDHMSLSASSVLVVS